MISSYIGLGSNLQNPADQLLRAIEALGALKDSRLLQVSGAYRSKAVGPGNQPDYLNAVALLQTGLRPEALLNALQHQEGLQGRNRDVRWEPRTLDLDILLYGELELYSPRLVIPHPAMRERNFVLYPLRELCGANYVLPDGAELDTLVRDCPTGGLSRTELRLHDHGPE